MCLTRMIQISKILLSGSRMELYWLNLHGSYWDLGSKIAVAFVFTAWSPDSHLFIKVEQRAESASVELFAFAEDDTALHSDKNRRFFIRLD